MVVTKIVSAEGGAAFPLAGVWAVRPSADMTYKLRDGDSNESASATIPAGFIVEFDVMKKNVPVWVSLIPTQTTVLEVLAPSGRLND